jgi:5-methylcytosine-specific restriction protein A
MDVDIELPDMEIYEEFIHSKEWRQLRANVLARDHWLCRICKKYTAWIVHHTTYDYGLGNPEALISVCGLCHVRLHRLAWST